MLRQNCNSLEDLCGAWERRIEVRRKAMMTRRLFFGRRSGATGQDDPLHSVHVVASAVILFSVCKGQASLLSYIQQMSVLEKYGFVVCLIVVLSGAWQYAQRVLRWAMLVRHLLVKKSVRPTPAVKAQHSGISEKI
jgi:hypothetical protein